MATKKLQILGSLGSNVELDTTLSKSDKAADAKAVGDALATKQPVGDYALSSEVKSISVLVGDTPVAEQINAVAVDTVADWDQTDESALDYIKNKPVEATSDDVMAWAAELGIAEPITSSNGSVYITNDNKILIL